jgi:disulfide bond formation protein DsbB
MVALGAGAALAGLVGSFPQLVWLSEHKGLTFGTAGILLGVAGLALWRGRHMPCPTDPKLARTCTRLRALSRGLYLCAVAAFLAGVIFTFVLPDASL